MLQKLAVIKNVLIQLLLQFAVKLIGKMNTLVFIFVAGFLKVSK